LLDALRRAVIFGATFDVLAAVANVAAGATLTSIYKVIWPTPPQAMA
jgi:hypothetical protein